ncbi:MAG: hypothetical protein JWQ57_3639 [Mucilaginibacter sp.]|nr:hypothetical protein [Mucilaginibacter sp.]
MKAKYIKGIMALSITALLFSSCLKDPGHVFNPEATTSNVVQFFNSNMLNFSADAATAPGLDTITFAVGVTAANPPSAPTTVTIGVDNTLITDVNGITYIPVPADAYTLPTKITIPAGKNNVNTTVIIDKTKLDPAVSYLLPVKIISSSPSLPIAANANVHYFHVIGNDFAGPYDHAFTRTPAASNYAFGSGHTALFIPDSHTAFEVVGGYYTAALRYVVSYTETGAYPNATYTNFQISINPDDVAIMTAAGIAVTNAPVINGYDSTHNYSYTEALALFTNGFTYSVLGGSGARVNLDQYQHP